jgi:hypothetical protein
MNEARRIRFCAPQRNHIGSIDPHDLKIPARMAEYSSAERALAPIQAEPTEARPEDFTEAKSPEGWLIATAIR